MTKYDVAIATEMNLDEMQQTCLWCVDQFGMNDPKRRAARMNYANGDSTSFWTLNHKATVKWYFRDLDDAVHFQLVWC